MEREQRACARLTQGALALALALGWPAQAFAQDLDVADLDLESMLEQSVTVSTKSAQRGAQTPAVVTIITGEELQAAGYASLAEALRAVPGFYDVYDLVSHNVGVRGINGGARAGGSVLKLMIDGESVDDRSTTANFFGEELIPLQAIERIEVIRGPASALYGANAFLGVVNVVTRSGASGPKTRLVGRAGLERGNPGGGVDLLVGAGDDQTDVLVAGGWSFTDRSGLFLPGSSPLLASGQLDAATVSSRDLSQPLGVFARASQNLGASGRVRLQGSLQQLDARGFFQDAGPMSGRTRVGLSNRHVWLSWDSPPHEVASFNASARYFSAGPTAQDRIDTLNPEFLLVRSRSVEGFGAAIESRFELHRYLALTAAADGLVENHELQTYSRLLQEDVVLPDGSVLRAAGTLVPGEGAGARRRFFNLGAFLQAVSSWSDSWNTVVGARLDQHSAYGFNPSLRAGAVYAPADRPLSLKFLYGSSFKAPSAEQLYTRPMQVGDILGNERLKAQTAHTAEVSFSHGLGSVGELSVNVFSTLVLGRVEFIQKGFYQVAENIDRELVVGGEADVRLKPARPLTTRLSLAAARTVSRQAGSVLTGGPEGLNPLYPALQAHLAVTYLSPWKGLRLSAEASWVGPRTSSQSNALLKGETYEVPSYVYTAAALALPDTELLRGHPTALALRVSNVLGQRWTEPGFGGLDVPAGGLTVLLTLAQSW